MRLVVQRVNKASVKVDGETVGEIEKGLFVLLGVGEGDTKDLAANLAAQISKLRIMADEQGKMNLSVKDVGASVLVVSQFTLYADTSKGNRPSFIKAADPKLAKELYKYFVDCLEKEGVTVAAGSFGEYMTIDAELDDPVTIILEEK